MLLKNFIQKPEFIFKNFNQIIAQPFEFSIEAKLRFVKGLQVQIWQTIGSVGATVRLIARYTNKATGCCINPYKRLWLRDCFVSIKLLKDIDCPCPGRYSSFTAFIGTISSARGRSVAVFPGLLNNKQDKTRLLLLWPGKATMQRHLQNCGTKFDPRAILYCLILHATVCF